MADTRKGTQKITNWSKYNESLIQRESITVWFCEETISKWRHDNANPRREQVDALLDQVPDKIDGFYVDGACDKWKTYETLANRRIVAVVPPQRNTKIKQYGNSSDCPLSAALAIRKIRRQGRHRWKKMGYHHRSLSETILYRMK